MTKINPKVVLFLLGFFLISGFFGIGYYLNWPGVKVLSPVFSTVLAILAGWGISSVRRKALNLSEKKKKKIAIITFGINLLYGVALFAILIPVLHEFGVPTSSLVTILGTSTLAIGLALKDFLGNIAAGMMLIFQRPFEIGDLVEIGGKLGKVDKVDLFSVRIKTPANETIYFPNGKLITDKIINKAHKGQRRLEVLMGIHYDSDVKKAKQVIYDLIAEDKRILQDPAPLVAVNNLNDSCIELTIRVWLQSKDFVSVKFDLLENILEKFNQNGINIPYPQLNVWLNKEA